MSLETFDCIFEKEILKSQIERTEMKLKHVNFDVNFDFDVKATGYESLNHLNDNNGFEDRFKSYKDKSLRLFLQHLKEKSTEKQEQMISEILNIVLPVPWFRKTCKSNCKAYEFAVNAALFPLIHAVNVKSAIDVFSCQNESITFVVNEYIFQLQ